MPRGRETPGNVLPPLMEPVRGGPLAAAMFCTVDDDDDDDDEEMVVDVMGCCGCL